jgi:hypothetical protein
MTKYRLENLNKKDLLIIRRCLYIASDMAEVRDLNNIEQTRAYILGTILDDKLRAIEN